MTSASEVIRVLHVDDEPDFAEMTAAFLERQDERLEIVTELDPTKAIDLVRNDGIDCIVSDYEMPGRNGLELLKSVRTTNPDIPFILFTGKGSEEIASEAITAGVTDYIQKESGTDQYTILANRVGNAVRQYRAERQTDLSYRAMETAHEGISLVNPDGTFSYVNPAFADLFGYEPAELTGEHWKILYHNQQAERLEHDILPAVGKNGYWSGETVRLTKQGQRLVTDHRLAHTAEGVIVCTAQDVTNERTDAAAQTQGLDLLADALGEYAFYTLDHEGYVTHWNDGAERLNGYQAPEVLGEHMSIFFTEEDQDMGVPERLLEAAKTDGKVTNEGWRIRKDGSRFWAEATISGSYDDAGTIRGFGEVIKESSQRLHQNNQPT